MKKTKSDQKVDVVKKKRTTAKRVVKADVIDTTVVDVPTAPTVPDVTPTVVPATPPPPVVVLPATPPPPVVVLPATPPPPVVTLPPPVAPVAPAPTVKVQPDNSSPDFDSVLNLMGKVVLFHCMNYNYIGRVVSVNDRSVQLDEMKVVFETGPYVASMMKGAEFVHNRNGFVNRASIESFWIVSA